MSGITTKNIARQSGIIGSVAAGGVVGQIVETTYSTKEVFNTSSYVASAGSKVTITPAAASSKIYLTYTMGHHLGSGGANNAEGMLAIYRDIASAGFAKIGGDWWMGRLNSDDRHSLHTIALSYLDSPSYTLTDAIEYKMYGHDNGQNASTWQVDRIGSTVNACPSRFQAWEILT